MKYGKLAFLGSVAALTLACLAVGSKEVAPDFTLASAKGDKVSLSQFKGKYVVLEWWNYGCPFVQKHYKSGNMPKLQKDLTSKGVVWLTIASSAPDTQGYVTTETASQAMKERGGAPTQILLDHEGTVGKLYRAKVTPHMFLISPEGNILYQGAIDSIVSQNVDDIAKADPYVLRAYGEATSGKEVSIPKTAPYGCTVKYKQSP